MGPKMVSAVNVLVLIEFWGKSSVSSPQPIICVPKRTQRVCCRTHRVLSSETENRTLETVPLVATWLQTDLNYFRTIYELTDTDFKYFGINCGIADTDLALLSAPAISSGGELPAKFGRRFSSFFCWGKLSEEFSTKTPPQISPSNFTTRFWVVAGPYINSVTNYRLQTYNLQLLPDHSGCL